MKYFSTPLLGPPQISLLRGTEPRSKQPKTEDMVVNEQTSCSPKKAKVRVEFHDDNNDSVAVVEVPEHTLISEAATKAGIKIPTLCHHPRLAPAGKCGLCVVSVENGPTPTQLACSTYCKKRDTNNNEGEDDDDSSLEEDLSARVADMVVHVNGADLNGLANAALKRNMEHSMVYREFQRSNQFAPCGTLEIEELGNYIKTTNVDTSSQSITYDPSLCVGCSRCVRACDQLQGMNVLELSIPDSQPTMGIAQAPPCMTTRTGRPLRDTDCISCGQCAVFCPTGAIQEVDHTARVMRALTDPEMVVVLQTAPSARVTIAEMFGGKPGDCSEQRLVGAAKACGFHFVFDTNVAADLTIVEEAHELLKRINIARNGTPEEKKKMPLPMFTSCCPGWINLVEQSYPKLMPHLSSCRSPLGMLSSLIRYHWWPKQSKARVLPGGTEVDQTNLFVVAVMPCTAKKDEAARQQFRMPNGRPETDAVLTVREFARLVELRGVAKRSQYDSFIRIPETGYDKPFGEATGAGAIFGTTGGVMEAALRTAADVISGKDLPEVKYASIRGLLGIKKSKVKFGDRVSLNVAVCHQMGNVREFLAQIENGNEGNYHFIEIMTCPGGCIGGGGLPQSKDPDILSKRMNGLYSIDERKVKRKAHENNDIQLLYRNDLSKPLSKLSRKWLHTNYFARPRKPLPSRKLARRTSIDLSCCTADRSDKITVYIVYGTQNGTSEQAAKAIKSEMKKCLARVKLPNNQETKIVLVAGNIMPPEKLVRKLSNSFMSVFVTPTYDSAGGNSFPAQLKKLWEYLKSCKTGALKSIRYAVFGLGSTMYAAFEEDLFNRAAKQLDRKLEDLGGERITCVGLGDDVDRRHYRDELDKWMGVLFPKLTHLIQSESDKIGQPGDPENGLFVGTDPNHSRQYKAVSNLTGSSAGGGRAFL